MKKSLLFLMFFAVGVAFAAQPAPAKSEPVVKKAAVQTDWQSYPISYLQIGIWNKFPRSQMKSNVIGIKSGWPLCVGEGSVTGLEASWIGSWTKHVNGLQLSWSSCRSDELAGLQAALGTCINRKCLIGLQAAPVFAMAGDVTGLQASAINISKNFKGFQPAAIVNVSDDVTGFQASLVVNVANDVTGMQAGIINRADKCSFQTGLVNVAKSGFQFGLINVMENGFLPFFPIINCGFAK